MTNEKQPILSICIPTYNRAEVLRDTLEHYTSCEEFDDDVEIVISDNASTDNTRDICERFISKYPNIRYYRNEENIRDVNFLKVLSYGRGDYLKLFNDTVYLTNVGLRYMKDMLNLHKNESRALFFTLGWTRVNSNEIECADLNEYIRVVALGVTSNNMFGTWRCEWETLPNKERYAQLQLMQVDWTSQLIVQNNGALLCNKSIIESSKSSANVFRSSYNFFKVHLDNYYSILNSYYEQGYISDETLKEDRKYFLYYYRKMLCKIAIHRGSNWAETKGTWHYIWKNYKKDGFFYIFLFTAPFWYVYSVISTRLIKGF